MPAVVQVTDPADWLQHLVGGVEGWLTIFSIDRTTGERHTDWTPTSNLDDVHRIVALRAPTCCIWFGVCTRKHQLADGKRGGADDCCQLVGLWSDIDVAGPNHKGAHQLPPTIDAAHELINSFPLPPTAIVRSGGGLQGWWMLHEPIPADTAAQALLNAWGATWAEHARRRGWHVDNVFDMARIMRLPGTQNRKQADAPVEVTAKAIWDRRYNVEDFEPYLFTAPAPPEPGRIPYIGPERAGDAFNAVRSGADVLAAAGWTHARTDRGTGDQHWTRPGKQAKDGTSATVYADGHTTIWSDTVTQQHPAAQTMRPYDPFGLYCVLFSDGDFTVAAEDLAAQGYGTSAKAADDLSWIPQPTADTDPAETTTTNNPQPSREDRRLAQLISEERLRRHARRVIDLEEQDADNDQDDTGPDPNIHVLLAEPEPEYRWLIPDLLERADRVILTGPEGGGKSTLLRQLAVQSAAGTHPFTLDDTEPIRVLYVDLENSRRHILRQFAPLVIQTQGTLALVPISRPEGIDLLSRRDEQWLTRRVEANKPDLLIVGPLYKLALGDPISEEIARHVAFVLDTIRITYDVALAIEAHQPHGSSGGHRPDRPYGASLWMRWPEFGLAISAAGFLNHWRGARDERDWPTCLQRGGTWPWTTATAVQATFAALLVACQDAGELLSVRELEKATGITKSTAQRAIDANREQWAQLAERLQTEDN